MESSIIIRQRRSRLKRLWLTAVILPKMCFGTECFPLEQNLLPHIFTGKDASGNPDYSKAQELYAIDGFIDPDTIDPKHFIVYGGGTEHDVLRYNQDPTRAGMVAVVQRMDLD